MAEATTSPPGVVTVPSEAAAVPDEKPTETALLLDVLDFEEMMEEEDATRRTSGPRSARGVEVGFGMSGKGPSTESVAATIGK